jgi:16S rRNA (cytosine967-C5)-methyltransferase
MKRSWLDIAPHGPVTSTVTRAHQQLARRIALQILEQVEHGDHADQLLDRVTGLTDPDMRLLREIVLGSITWRSRLDFLLNAYLKHPISKQKSGIRNLLRLGAYQILYLDRVPAYAVVSESVKLGRRYGKGVSGFINAVLRGLAEGRKSTPFPDKESNPALQLATELSHPEWLVERWLQRVGYARTKALCEAGNMRPPLTIRVNQKRATLDSLIDALTTEGIEIETIPDLPNFCRIVTPAGLFDSQPFMKGWFSVQGTGAGQAARLLEVTSGQSVLDVCAAPGGKSMSAAERGAKVIASDVNIPRLSSLRHNQARLGLSYGILASDARELPYSCTFDHVIVDAPCTGLGTLSRHPDIRWHRKLDDIARMALLQREILASAANYVTWGGTLVYSTCSTEPEENEQIVENFLDSNPDFRLDQDSQDPTTINILPGADGTDGAYGVRMRKSPEIAYGIA